MKTGDEVVLLYAVIPKEKYDKLSIPDGSFAKAIIAGKVESFVQMSECRNWGMLVATSLQILARKICPDVANSPIIQLDSH